MKRYDRFFSSHEYREDYLTPLLEKTFDIDEDIDLIYNVGFKSFVESLVKGEPLDDVYKILRILGVHTFKILQSSELKSQDCKNVHKENPIELCLRISKDKSIYSATRKRIEVSLHANVFLSMYSGDWNKKFDSLSKSKKELVSNEFTEKKIKSTIAHELSHWLDDTLHNMHISNLQQLANYLGNGDILKLKQKHVALTYFEIDAQIHGIKNLKRECSNLWDEMTITSMFFSYNSLAQIAVNVNKKYGKDIADIWQKNLMKRMAREGLLGKNMRSFADYDKLTENEYGV